MKIFWRYALGMTQEQIALTQQVTRTYAKDGVIFMATEATNVAEEASVKDQAAKTAEGRTDSKGGDSQKLTPEQIHQRVQEWKVQFENQLNEALQTSRESRILIAEASPKAISRYLTRLDNKAVVDLLVQLSEIDQQLQILEKGSDATTQQVRDVVKKVEEVREIEQELREEITQRREKRAEEFQVEKADITSKEGSTVDAQVFETFQQYLGTEGVSVKTDPSATEITVVTAADGQKIVSVPSPTLENMIAVAKQLGLGEFSEKTRENLGELAKELKGAAAFLDKHVFSPEAIAVLYNTGSQLEQLARGVKAGEVKKFDAYDRKLFEELHMPEMQPENMPQALREKILLNVLFGRHDLKISTTERKLYDVYFRRWRRHNPGATELPLDEQQKQFDAYLVKEYLNPEAKNNEEKEQAAKRLDKLLNLFREPIERSLKAGGKASRNIAGMAQQEVGQEMLTKALDPWRLLVDRSEYGSDKKGAEAILQAKIGELAKHLSGSEGQLLRSAGLIESLEEFNRHFQPDQQSELLDYVPANLRARLANENRDAVACIVAVAYEQKALQESLGDRYVVVPELTGTHATILVVDLDGHSVVRVDPSVPRDFKQSEEDLVKNGPKGAVISLELDDPYVQEIFEKIGEQNPSEDPSVHITEEGDLEIDFKDIKGSAVELSVQKADARGIVHTAIAGNRLVTSALLSNMVAQGFVKDASSQEGLSETQAYQVNLAAAQQAVRLAPENPVAMKVLGLVQSAAPKSYLDDLVDTRGYYKESLAEASEYLKKRSEELDESLVGKQELQDLKVGEWKPFPPGTTVPAELQGVIDRVNAELEALGRAQTPPILPGTPEFDALSVSDLPMDSLKDYGDMLGELRKSRMYGPSYDASYVDQASKLLKQVNREFNKQRAAMGRGEDTITSFGLTPREQEIFSGDDDALMMSFIEKQLEDFGVEINPGGFIPTNSANIVQSRLDDIYKILNSNPKRFPGTKIDRAFRLVNEYKQIIVSPVIVAADIESGDHRRREGAGEQANKMDSSGGHDVLGTILELHGGMSHMLADEMWRIMEQVRNDNLRLTGKDGYKNVAIITPAQYKMIRDGIIERQLEMADVLEIGRYKAVKDKLKGTKDPTHDWFNGEVYEAWEKKFISDNDSKPEDKDKDKYFLIKDASGKTQFEKDLTAALKKRITVDANFAHVEFIIDGRASAIGIRGDNPNVFDPTTNPFLDGQYKDNVRYDIFTATKKKVFQEMRISRAAVYIRLRYGEDVLKQIAPHSMIGKGPTKEGKLDPLLERFINLNGIELLTPATDKYWENTFIRTKSMLYVMKRWRAAREHELGAASKISPDVSSVALGDGYTEFGLGLRLLNAEVLVRPGGEFSNFGPGDNPDDMDPLMLSLLLELRNTNNPYYTEKTWESYSEGGETRDAYRMKALRYKLMEKYISVFYPEEMMKPFAYEPDLWADKSGQSFDKRFVGFFSGGNAAFLDGVLSNMEAKMHKAPGELRDMWKADIVARFGNDPETVLAQLRFKIFQEFIAPIMASVRSDNINGLDPDTHVDPVDATGAKKPKIPCQTNFGARTYKDFDKLGAGVADKFKDLMAAMTVQVKVTSGRSISFHGHKIPNSLIARLAYDPMLDHVLVKSPITIADVPYWMLHGKDIFEKEHPFDIKEALGGENQVGRHIGDTAFVSKGREGILKVAMGNPAQIEETMIKPLLEEVTETIAGQKSRKLAAETELSVAGVLYRMMVAQGAELIGAEALPLYKNSKMRKIFGRQMRAMNEAQLKSVYQSQFMTRMTRPEYQALMQKILFGTEWRRRRRGLFKIFWAMFLVTLMQTFTTGSEMFSGELQSVGK